MELMSTTGKTRFYFGASYGSAQTALRRLEEPHVMLSYATSNNNPWKLYNRFQKSFPSLFIDCGAYSVFDRDGWYQTSVDDYLEYVANAEDKLEGTTDIRFALRDVPCSPDVLEITGLDVETHQFLTVEWHKECLEKAREMEINATPVMALQGETPEDYVRHLEMHIDAGTFRSMIGIGSLARRDVDEIRRILEAVHGKLDRRHQIHGFGINPRALADVEVRRMLDSADSSKWSYGQYVDRIDSDERLFHLMSKKYVDAKRVLSALFALDTVDVLPEKDGDLDLELCRDVLTDEIVDGELELPAGSTCDVPVDAQVIALEQTPPDVVTGVKGALP